MRARSCCVDYFKGIWTCVVVGKPDATPWLAATVLGAAIFARVANEG
jgi:hypothetical protein